MRLLGGTAVVCLVLTGACGGGASAGGGGTVIVPAGTPTALAIGAADGPWEIALDATDVYWTDIKANTVMKVPKVGGTAVALASDQASLRDIAVGGGNVYWTIYAGAGSVMKVPTAGGTPVAVAAEQIWPVDVAADATKVYWLTTGDFSGNGNPTTAVMKAAHDTGAITRLASDAFLAVTMAVDATAVYWTTSGEPFSTILKVPLAGGTATDPVYGFSNASELAGHDGDLYFVSYDNRQTQAKTTIMKVAAGSDGVPIELAATSGRCLIVDGATLYWVAGGAISWMSVDGGGVMKQVQTGEPISNLALDATHFYFTTTRGAVMALAKP